jgi:hypothetical protein
VLGVALFEDPDRGDELLDRFETERWIEPLKPFLTSKDKSRAMDFVDP